MSDYETARRIVELIDALEFGEDLTLQRVKRRFGVKTAAATRYLAVVQKLRPSVKVERQGTKRWSLPRQGRQTRTTAEAVALELALQSLQWLEGTEYFSALSALSKSAIPDGGSSDAAHVQLVTHAISHMSIRGAAEKSLLQESIRAVVGGIAKSRYCAMKYSTLEGVTNEYRIAPHRIVLHHGVVSVIARKHPSMERRIFELDGIQRIELLNEHFTPALHSEIHDKILDDSFGVYVHDAPPEDIRLRVRGVVRGELERRPAHRSQTLGAVEGVWRDVSFRVVVARPLRQAILSWIPNVKVIAPQSLRLDVEEAVKAFLADGGE